jgi:hypothetical protein
VTFVLPYGEDLFQHAYRLRSDRDVAVAWKDDPAYADKVIAWWLTN